MDDFDNLYSMRLNKFSEGVNQGQQQADTYDFEDVKVEAR